MKAIQCKENVEDILYIRSNRAEPSRHIVRPNVPCYLPWLAKL